MKNKIIGVILFFALGSIVIGLSACNKADSGTIEKPIVTESTIKDSSEPKETESFVDKKEDADDSKELYNFYEEKIDIDLSDYNDKKDDYTPKGKSVVDKSAEEGYIEGEFDNDKLVAYVAEFYGEIGKNKIQYYAFSGYTYVINTTTQYNAPIFMTKEYLESDQGKEFGEEQEFFDETKSDVMIKEYLQKNGDDLVYIIDRDNKKCYITEDKADLDLFKEAQHNKELINTKDE